MSYICILHVRYEFVKIQQTNGRHGRVVPQSKSHAHQADKTLIMK